jgi:2-methylisocitrate lyase-like PEP mutase family enzyme
VTFHDLHHADAPLVLPNAWDVGSAIAFLDAGFEAIGTTSFGVSAAGGRPDGDGASKDATVALVHALQGLPVYVTADVEDGFADDPDTVAELVAGLGVAGINIEDSADGALTPAERHAAKIAAIKSRTPDVFINARVDNYWFGEDATITAVLERATTYVEAGADGIFIPFVPGAVTPEGLATITSDVSVPVNVLVDPNLTLTELARLGIRRISTGSLPYRAAVDAAVAVATAVRDNGHPAPATPYHVAQEQLVKYAPILDNPRGT